MLTLPTIPFGQALYPIANREVGDEASYLQEEEEVSNFSRSQFLQEKVEILSPQDYPHVHPVMKRLLYVQNLQSFHPASGLQYFLKNWEKLTNDPFISELVKSYQTPFLSEPSQTAPTSSISMSQEGTAAVD